MPRSDIRRGQLWRVASVTEGGAASTGLVVQADPANQNPRYADVIVLAVTERGAPVPFHVPIRVPTDNEPAHPAYVRCERITTIAKERLVERLGQISREDLEKVGEALRLVLAL